MEIKKTLVVESSEPLSKAAAHLDESGAVIVTKDGKYYGTINRESLMHGFNDLGSVKCEHAVIKTPTLTSRADLMEQMDAFLNGHYRAIPVIDEQQRPVGVTSRVDLLKDLYGMKMTPNSAVADLMNAPVYTVDEKETIAKAKGIMKDKGVKRLVVLGQNGFAVGVISEFEIAHYLSGSNLKSGKMNRETTIDLEGAKLSSFLRSDLSQVEESTSVTEAINKMIRNGTSEVVVVSSKKPVGVLSSLDIFKAIKESRKGGLQIVVSGLSKDSSGQMEHITSRIGHVVEKFGKTLDIRSASVHVKEGKSSFAVNLNVETTEGNVMIKHERPTLTEAVDEIAKELDTIFRKKKEMRKVKPRSVGVAGDE